MPNDLLSAALDLAVRGFRIFPLVPGTKRPAVEKWQERATTDVEKITKLWSSRNYNIGVACGRGLLVLDVDVKDGKPGKESLAALNLNQETYTVETPSGGFHVYFNGPDVPNSAGRLGPGLDIRSAGGYVVGVGSVCDGRPYRLVRNGGCRVASEDFVARCGTSRVPGTAGVPATLSAGAATVELDDEAAVLRGRDWLRGEAPVSIEGDNGDHTTFIVAARIKDFGISESVALELMLDHWNERCSPPWDIEQLQTKVENAYRYGQNPPGSDHPAALFAGVDVDPPPAPPAPVSSWARHGDQWDRDVSWLYYRLVPAVGVAVIVGQPQSGKTFLEGELARSLATGKPFFGVEPDKRGGTIFLFAGSEGSSFLRRLDALQETEVLPISATQVEDLSGRGALTKLLDLLREEAARMGVMFGVPLRMVVLETLSASGLLVDENNNAEAGRAMSNLGKIAEALGILFVTTHHPPAKGSGPRGASAIVASADYVLEIEREGRDTLRRLELTKARDAEQRSLGTFSLVPVDLGRDNRGRKIESMTVSMGEPIKGAAREPKRMDKFNDALDFALGESETVIEGVKAAIKDDVWEVFKELVSDIANRQNQHRTWRQTLAYAQDMGVIESRVVHGVHYLMRKEIIA